MTPPTAPRPLVLVVAGSAPASDDLRRLLELSGIDVLAPGDDAARQRPFAVVVADLDRIQTLPPEHRAVPVLAMVRRGAPDELVAAIAAGALDVLPLPIAGAEAQARVAVAIRLSLAEAGLRSRNAELDAWAHRAGHDLMTPLAVVSGMAQTLETSWDRLPEADRARLLAAIRNQASRATTMLDEALALARGSETGTMGRPTGG